MDSFTKWIEAFPLNRTIAEIFIKIQIIWRSVEVIRIKKRILRMFLELTQLLKILKIKTIPFHSQSNGQMKRQQQTFYYLTKYVFKNQTLGSLDSTRFASV